VSIEAVSHGCVLQRFLLASEPSLNGTVDRDGMQQLAQAPIHRSLDDSATTAPVCDIVIPVYNESHVVDAKVRRLHEYLSDAFPFSWRITIVDNASTDGTWYSAARLARDLAHVRACHLDRKGRGLALRTAWSASDATVVAYMDVDLSTGLEALLPLVAPIVSGLSDVAIGSRLMPGASVTRSLKREVLSRGYNLLLRATFATSVHDAQCGFKAVRASAARKLLPIVRDEAWFFDTELLLVAQQRGMRVDEIPVAWVEDRDSRVRVASTVVGDLEGVVRMARTFGLRHTRLPLTFAVGIAVLTSSIVRRKGRR
jgi:glycosyltransferase involved in cell wall biosynthesis